MITPVQLPTPSTLEEAGLSLDLVTQLVLKTLYFAGELSGADVARRLGVHFGVVEPALEFLKVQHHCEVVGAALVGGPSYRYRVTTEGRTVARLFLEQSQYVGIAPVPFAQYRTYMAAHRRATNPNVTRDQVRQGLSHLVLGSVVLDEIGPAVNSGQSIFIYGQPGNGKTTIAYALRNLLFGDIEVPHALEVEGSIIRVFDPITHEATDAAEDNQLTVNVSMSKDRRWTTCRRPMVIAGGELTLESLDLSYDARLGYYRAPLQLIANGGMLLIDDFGRQRAAPRDLLNRWMVPLEGGMDFLTLQSGWTFEVPFQVFIAFATNIKPADLVDEAFLRRVRYKVFAEGPSPEDFVRIFEDVCRDQELVFDKSIVEGLLGGYFHRSGAPLRACQPRDLISHALLLANYRGQPRELTLELLETACAGYFVEDRG
jgi:predicted ATPase with chaperone activity